MVIMKVSSPRSQFAPSSQMAKRNGGGGPVELQNMVASQLPTDEDEAELQLGSFTEAPIATNTELGVFPCRAQYDLYFLIFILFYSVLSFYLINYFTGLWP